MKLIGRVVALLFGVSLLFAIGFGTWLGFQGVVALFGGLDPQVATVTGIGCMVALAISWVIARAIRASGLQRKTMTLCD